MSSDVPTEIRPVAGGKRISKLITITAVYKVNRQDKAGSRFCVLLTFNLIHDLVLSPTTQLPRRLSKNTRP